MMSHHHDPVRNAAQALRLILSLVDRGDREVCVDAFQRIATEFEDCADCSRAVLAHVAAFAADSITDADRPLCDRITFLLDAADRHDERGTS